MYDHPAKDLLFFIGLYLIARSDPLAAKVVYPPLLLICYCDLVWSVLRWLGPALAVICAAALVCTSSSPLFWFGVDFADRVADVADALDDKLPPRTALEVVVATV